MHWLLKVTYISFISFFFLEGDSPKSSPRFSILSAHKTTDKQETCLAAGFYPKEGTLLLNVEGKNKPVTIVNPPLSRTGKYYYAAFSSGTIHTCKMNDTDDKHEGYSKYYEFVFLK